MWNAPRTHPLLPFLPFLDLNPDLEERALFKNEQTCRSFYMRFGMSSSTHPLQTTLEKFVIIFPVNPLNPGSYILCLLFKVQL